MNKNLKCENPQNQGCPKSGESEQKGNCIHESWKIAEKNSKLYLQIVSAEILKRAKICYF